MGKLFIIATPIGNLKDITVRAVETLKTVSFIACEDTRKTGLLLHELGINPPKLISFYEENELYRIPEIITLIEAGNSLALVSDAGTPLISDPGFKLVRECIKKNIVVESIPGPSAVLAALTSSGLPTDKFLFVGYLPQKPGKRLHFLQNLSSSLQSMNSVSIEPTIILYESPHRLIKTLNDINSVFGDIDIVVARELTKLHEEIRREPVSQSIEYFKIHPPKGEFTLLFHQ